MNRYRLIGGLFALIVAVSVQANVNDDIARMSRESIVQKKLISKNKINDMKNGVAEEKQKEVDKAIYDIENPNLTERLKKHPFFLYRIAGWILYSVVTVVSAIGAGLAWIIAMVAAG